MHINNLWQQKNLTKWSKYIMRNIGIRQRGTRIRYKVLYLLGSFISVMNVITLILLFAAGRSHATFSPALEALPMWVFLLPVAGIIFGNSVISYAKGADWFDRAPIQRFHPK